MKGWVKVLRRWWKDLTNTRKLRRRVRELEQECDAEWDASVELMYRLWCADEIERLISNERFLSLLDEDQKNALAEELLRRLGILGEDE